MAGPAIDFDLENEDTAEFSGLRSDPGVLNMALASAAAEGGGLNPARLAIVGGGAFLLTVIVGSILIFSSGDDAPSDAPLTPAEANEVIGEVEPVGKPSRTGRQWHDLARAYAAVNRQDDALESWLHASKTGGLDDGGVKYCVEQLADPFYGDKAVKVLVAMPSSTGIDKDLEKALKSESSAIRHGALKAMEQRGSATVAHGVDVAIYDLLSAPTCAERKEGLLRLKQIASGEDRARAIQAIQKVEDAAKGQLVSCMLPHLKGAKETIMNR